MLSLMPVYNKEKDFEVVEIPMSLYQFNIYEEARVQERKLDKHNAKKTKKGKTDGIYDDTASTYRIFSRAFCNFVFPTQIARPMPNNKSIGESIEEGMSESAIEAKTKPEQEVDDIDGKLSADEILNITENKAYEVQISEALEKLEKGAEEFLIESK